MKEIILENWSRKSHYLWFSSFTNPCFDMNVRLDVTNFLVYCKKNALNSFGAMVYLCAKAANSVEAFKLRTLDGNIFLIDRANVGYTIPVGDGFVNGKIDTNTDIVSFCKNILINKENAQKHVQKVYNNVKVIDDIYCSCLPWIDFVSVTQPIPDKERDNLCIPRICWGKYTEEDNRIKMSMNVTASHALVDGRDMAELFNIIQDYLNNPEKLGE